MKQVTVQGRRYWLIPTKDIKQSLPQFLPMARPGYVKNVTLHWTAGSYQSGYRAYQILVGPGHIMVSEKLLAFYQHQHTWGRNSRNIGVCFKGMAGATERNAGSFPVTKQMIEDCSLVVGMLQKKYGLSKPQAVDHSYWAKIDGYSSYRWDVRYPLENGETIMDMVRRKAWWYRGKLRSA